MIKYFVLLFNLMGLLIFNFFTNDVTITMTAPKEVQAGGEFTVELVINKGKVTGLGRFQQDLPEGLTAVNDANSQLVNGDFKYQYQKLRIMWLLLPADETFTVKYTVKVDPTCKGKIKIGGQFIYLKDNTRIPVDIPEQTINVTPGTGIPAPKDTVKTNNAGTLAILPPDRNVKCIRQKPVKNEAGDALVVKLDVTKDFTGNMAKIIEDIPSGYIAEPIEVKDGIFSFKDKKVKISWMVVPADPSYTVSYKLKPEDKYVTLGDVSINGTFSFVEKEIPYEIKIVEEGSSLAMNDKKDQEKKDQEKKDQEKKDQELKDAQAKKDQEKTDKEKTEQEKKDAELKKKEADKAKKEEEKKRKEEEKRKEQERKKESADKKNSEKKNSTVTNNVPNPQKGVVYKIQLAAGHSLICVSSYFRNLKVNEKVATELHDGWRKYTVGAFPQYKSARDYRVFIWDSTPISDAFVSAYNDGNRITVQEALMIANQKWIK
ncbi:MAG: cell envelope integrity protein TolA [Bacteroidia bacterium]|nr:cell envelope integrity protein TolA [Bacteroidia bacterium]